MARFVLTMLVSIASTFLVACGGSSSSAQAHPTYEGRWTIDKQAMKAETEAALKQQLKGIAPDLIQQHIEAATNAIDQSATSLLLNKSGTYSLVTAMGNRAQTQNGTWKRKGSAIVLSTAGRPEVEAHISEGKLHVANPTGDGPKYTILVRARS